MRTFKDVKGFTLIEMLVVVAIIVILASMVLPVLMAARKEGNTAKCKNNMRQFAGGFEIFKTNNNELLPGRLTALYPDYCDNMALFLCPADMTRGKEGGKPDIAGEQFVETNETGSSYFYEFSSAKCSWDFSSIGSPPQVTGDSAATEASWSQVKYYQMNNGDGFHTSAYPPDRFPVIRCFWHTVNPDANKPKIILNLSFTGRIFESGPEWEKTAF